MIDIDTTFTKYSVVYYDTLFQCRRINREDILTIYKLDFDYNNASLNQKNVPIVINFGNSNSITPYNSTRSSFVNTIYIKKEKAVFILGLKWLASNATQTIGGLSHIGDAYVPVIYKYYLNEHRLEKLYTDDETMWQTFVQGDKISSHPVLSAYDEKSGKLGMIYKVIRTINSIATRCYIEILFDTNPDITLSDVKIMNVEATNGDYNSSFVFQKYVIDQNKRYIIASGIRNGKRKTIMLKLNAEQSTDTDTYLVSEDRRFVLGSEDDDSLIAE
jgi:hypothetical protein